VAGVRLRQARLTDKLRQMDGLRRTRNPFSGGCNGMCKV
jgi:hypothetical protein